MSQYKDKFSVGQKVRFKPGSDWIQVRIAEINNHGLSVADQEINQVWKLENEKITRDFIRAMK